MAPPALTHKILPPQSQAWQTHLLPVIEPGAAGFEEAIGAQAIGAGFASDHLQFADMNGDGKPDILTANAGEPNGIFFGDGDGNFDPGVHFGSPTGNTFSVAVADFDLDGDVDIVAGNNGQHNAVFFNTGDGHVFEDLQFGTAEEITYWLTTGDVDGDGFPDIGVANSEGLNGIYLNRPETGNPD